MHPVADYDLGESEWSLDFAGYAKISAMPDNFCVTLTKLDFFTNRPWICKNIRRIPNIRLHLRRYSVMSRLFWTYASSKTRLIIYQVITSNISHEKNSNFTNLASPDSTTRPTFIRCLCLIKYWCTAPTAKSELKRVESNILLLYAEFCSLLAQLWFLKHQHPAKGTSWGRESARLGREGSRQKFSEILPLFLKRLARVSVPTQYTMGYPPVRAELSFYSFYTQLTDITTWVSFQILQNARTFGFGS